MAKSRTLKEQNSRLIWTFFSFNVILYYVLTIPQFGKIADFEISSFLSVKGVWILIVPLILFILNGIISSDLKATLCFWKIKNPLPACRAFSKYVDKDDRIDKAALQVKYGTFPTTPKEQNALWYKIYKSHQENPVVKKSHKDFLLGRDLCSISFLFLIFGGISMLIILRNDIKWLYFSFLIIQYLVLVIVTQNHGKRFVCNALAIETSL
jgi:hypothetical protein